MLPNEQLTAESLEERIKALAALINTNDASKDSQVLTYRAVRFHRRVDEVEWPNSFW
jgi:hypothetical protein